MNQRISIAFDRFDAVTFDCYGTLIDWETGAREALRPVAERASCDLDLFDASRPKLGVPFDWVITAQQVGAYKPEERNFEVAFARIGLPRERILHVAQSLFHDHAPAQRLGMTSVWIDRRADRPGSGATPPSDAAPDATFPDMASFAAAATA